MNVSLAALGESGYPHPSAPEWREVCALARDVALQAAYVGHACERFCDWELHAMRIDDLPTAGQTTRVAVLLTHRHRKLGRAEVAIATGHAEH